MLHEGSERTRGAGRMSVVLAIALMAVLAGAGFLVGAAVGSPGTSAEERPAVSATPVQSVAEQWIDALRAKDVRSMAALFTADATWEDGATGDSFQGAPAAVYSGWNPVLQGSSEVKEARILGMGDGVAIVAWTIYTTPPAQTSPIDLPGISVLQVKDGGIVRETIYYNTTAAYGD